MGVYQYPLKIDPEVMEKIKEISEHEGRSVNKQIEFILKKFISEYSSE